MKSSPDQLFEDPSGSRRKTQDISVRLSREEAYRIAIELPQAILKVVSYGHDWASVGRQLDYISREGDIELEDADGETLTREEVKERLLDWKVDFDTKRKRSRESLHMILSSPKGSPVLAVEEAARRFAGNVFSENHDYLFALHQDTNNTHVHLVVKLRGYDGKKLDPRKADLRAWRDAYAEQMRDVGINVGSSSRLARGIGRKNTASWVYHINRHEPEGSRVYQAALKEAEANFKAGVNPAAQPWAKAMRAISTQYKSAMEGIAVSMLGEAGRTGDHDLDEKSQVIYHYASRMKTPRSLAEDLLHDHQQRVANAAKGSFFAEQSRLQREKQRTESLRHREVAGNKDVENDIDMDFEP